MCILQLCPSALLHIYSLYVIIAIAERGEEMARLNANIDDCTYVELKKMAVEKGTTITAIVNNLVIDYLCEQTKNKTAQKNKKRDGITR